MSKTKPFVWVVSFILVCIFLATNITFAGDQCDHLLPEWADAYEQLQEAVSELKEVKAGNLSERIIEEIKHSDSRSSIAACVRKVLQQRTRYLQDQQHRVKELRDAEKRAYSKSKACLLRSRNRDNNDIVSDVDLKSRKELVAGIPALLLDEAFLQYKDYRPPTPPPDYNHYWRYTYRNINPRGRSRSPQSGYLQRGQINQGYLVVPQRGR